MSTVVSRSGVSGASIVFGDPSGFRAGSLSEYEADPAEYRQNVLIDTDANKRSDDRFREVDRPRGLVLPITDLDGAGDDPGKVAGDAIASRSSVEIGEIRVNT